MTKRGRKSAAELGVVSVMGERPRPPAELMAPEREVWDAVINCHPGGWLAKDAFPILTNYCRHVVRAHRAAMLIEQLEGSDDFNITEWSKLLDIHEKQSRAVLAFGRSLRITHQARLRAESAKAVPDHDGPKPWEFRG